jgi:hypothetical protein
LSLDCRGTKSRRQLASSQTLSHILFSPPSPFLSLLSRSQRKQRQQLPSMAAGEGGGAAEAPLAGAHVRLRAAPLSGPSVGVYPNPKPFLFFPFLFFLSTAAERRPPMVAGGGCSATAGPLANERAHRGVSTPPSSGSASVHFAPTGSSFRPVAALSFRTTAIAPTVREDPGRSFNFSLPFLCHQWGVL